ncbi:winged helix DNA-binding protein [Nocardia sp. NPDC049707]|uniref:MarR family winged helix-turn-helix transcriptional regulator n=1 Tax=Nocardia sp. NPDC049707 TaxID=3154735 RepID=UPI003441AD90
MRIRSLLLGVLAATTLPMVACSSEGQDVPASTVATDPPNGRLIGYQLKRLDQLIESTFDKLLNEAGLTRRQWQTLNTISRGPADMTQLMDALRPFWEVNQENVAEVVAELTARGWVEQGSDSRYLLTPAGREAHGDAANTVDRIRDLSATGVAPEEFDTMMDVMGRLIANLERVG